ncbi:hypothetical protein JW964_04585 [candidate division KSB1 bacterium]|nr:hypothetical protein [candidate division KSB1 bacterium]
MKNRKKLIFSGGVMTFLVMGALIFINPFSSFSAYQILEEAQISAENEVSSIKPGEELPPSLLQQQISELDKNTIAAHLTIHDKEKFIQIALCLNYLIVFSMSWLIIARTRKDKTDNEEN